MVWRKVATELRRGRGDPESIGHFLLACVLVFSGLVAIGFGIGEGLQHLGYPGASAVIETTTWNAHERCALVVDSLTLSATTSLRSEQRHLAERYSRPAATDYQILSQRRWRICGGENLEPRCLDYAAAPSVPGHANLNVSPAASPGLPP